MKCGSVCPLVPFQAGTPQVSRQSVFLQKVKATWQKEGMPMNEPPRATGHHRCISRSMWVHDDDCKRGWAYEADRLFASRGN